MSTNPQCTRCAECCFEPFEKHVSLADLERWRQVGRHDLIAACEEERASSADRSRPEMAAIGLSLFTCRYVETAGEGRFACSIYEDRPKLCADFEPGCSKICPVHPTRIGGESMESIRRRRLGLVD